MPENDTKVDFVKLRAASLPTQSPVRRFTSHDPKEFAASLAGYDSRYLPTTEDHLFSKVELLLPSGRLVVVRRPPMVFEGVVSANEGLVAFLLDDSPKAKINGRLMNAHNITVWRKGTHYRGYEDLPLTHCSFFMSDTFRECNWPEASEGSFFLAPQSVFSLRSHVRDIVKIMEGDPTRLLSPNVLSGIDQCIINGIDRVLVAAAKMKDRTATYRYVLICKRAEEYLRGSRYRIRFGTEVADACEVTMRTLHSAFVAVFGMSLNKYLVLHRLWLARHALRQADNTKLIKSIALDHGFWHMGHFSRVYYSRFRELPSETLANSRSERLRLRAIQDD